MIRELNFSYTEILSIGVKRLNKFRNIYSDMKKLTAQKNEGNKEGSVNIEPFDPIKEGWHT